MLVTTDEYAKMYGLKADTVRRKIGQFTTAHKEGRQWFIESTEVIPDMRTRDGRAVAKNRAERKKYTMKSLYNEEAWNALTERERRQILFWEQAKEYSGLKQYPTACQEIFNRIPEDATDRYTCKELGEIARLIYQAYEDGKQYGREHPDEESSIY